MQACSMRWGICGNNGCRSSGSPEMLPKMYQVLNKEGYDAVGTRRVTRKGEPAIRSFLPENFTGL